MNKKQKKPQSLRPTQRVQKTSLLSESMLLEDIVQELNALGYTTQRDLALELQDYGYGRVRSYAEVRRLCRQTELSSYDNKILDLLRGKTLSKKNQAGNPDIKQWPSLSLAKSKLPQDVVAQLCANGISTQRDLVYVLEHYGYTRDRPLPGPTDCITVKNMRLSVLMPFLMS